MSFHFILAVMFPFQLEEVMEKETYKKAREILEKFDPERFEKLEVYCQNHHFSLLSLPLVTVAENTSCHILEADKDVFTVL